MSPICFPSHISWTCALLEATKALRYMLYPSALLWLSGRGSIKATSNVTLFFRVGTKGGTFAGSWVSGRNKILSLTASDELFSDATSPQWRFCFSLVVIVSVAINHSSCNLLVWRLFSNADHGQASQGLAQEMAGRDHLPHSHLPALERGCTGMKWAVLNPWELASLFHCGQSLDEGNGRGFQLRLPASPWVRSHLGQLNKPCAIRFWLVWGDDNATEQSAGH